MGTNKALAQVGATPAVKETEKVDGEQRLSRKSRNCLHKQLRKTKFCMFHLQNACQFGQDCAFAHSVTEMNSTPDLRKTQLCKAFAEGKCEDPECSFAHGEVELRSTDMFFKKSLCIWNEKGKCRNGSQCRFAHGLTELRLHLNNKEVGHATESPTQSKAGRQRKGKQNQNHKISISSVNGSSSDNTHISSENTNSPRSGSSSDNFSQHSAAEPMKIQPQSVSPQEPGMVVPEQMQSQRQDTLSSCLGTLDNNYLAFETARWQQLLNSTGTNGYNPDLQADLENLRKNIGMLTAQCNQIQERMQSTAVKMPPWVPKDPTQMPPWMPCMLQNPGPVAPYPDVDPMLLWQMQMQAGV